MPRRDAAQHCLAERLLLNSRDNFFRDLKIDVGLEQRKSHLSQRTIDVRLGDGAVAPQVLENVLQLIAELRKHLLRMTRTRLRRHFFFVGDGDVDVAGAAAAF